MEWNDYAMKWEIKLGHFYKEILIDLFAQGFFLELWEQIERHSNEAAKVFIEEARDIQFKFLADNLNLCKRAIK